MFEAFVIESDAFNSLPSRDYPSSNNRAWPSRVPGLKNNKKVIQFPFIRCNVIKLDIGFTGAYRVWDNE